MPRRACFFAKVSQREHLERTEFYAQDVRILTELGFDVRIAASPRELVPADIYFCWWWTWAFLPATLARIFQRPLVVTGVFDFDTFNQRRAAQRALMRYALRAASANVFLSEVEVAQAKQRFEVSRPRYIPLGVDTNLYRPNGDCREEMILSVAWLQAGNAERKGIPESILATHRLQRRRPGVRLFIAGEKASGYPPLWELVSRLGASDHVAFLGAISRNEKIRLMQRCKIYLQPSRFEGFGVAILEAMSCGAAVLTRPVGAVPEVVGDAGFLVDASGVEAIEAGLCELLEDDGLRVALGRRARSRAQEVFPYERRRRELAELVDEILQ
jgi:glycosyltransferase involved in cell wall biosynthesis